MPSRPNKRQQRELEELEALAGGRLDLAEVSSDDEIPIGRSTAASFSNLLVHDDPDESSDQDEAVKPTKSRKKKKKKKPTTETPIVSPSPVRNLPIVPLPKNEKKALKKAKAREKKAGNDELDKALAELSVKYPEFQASASTNSNDQSLSSLLSVSLLHLDSEAEMRKFFGAKVVQANKTGTSGNSSRRQAAQRSNLTHPQATWWPSNLREGLSLRALTIQELESKPRESALEKWWTVEYSKRYRSATRAFLSSVMAGDPEAFWALLKKIPWHADTLLQLSEVYRHREEYAQAVDFVDRAIFAYERAFVGAFNFTTGTNRLDFNRVENRPFFLAIHRQVADLQRRGCVRTAFEFARLLYSLDPWGDPHGALYHLDLLAIKAGMGQWLLDVYDLFAKRRERLPQEQEAQLDPSLLPGWAYSRALALRAREQSMKDKDHTESTAALKQALLSFPMAVPLLADKIDVTLPAPVRSHRDFRIETDRGSLSANAATLHLLSHLYVQRSFGIWKEPDHASWFRTTVSDIFASLPSALPITGQTKGFLSLYQHEMIRYTAYRHIVVQETTYRRLFAFIPSQVVLAKTLSCDPLPPPSAISQYDDDFFQGTEELLDPRISSRAAQRRLQQIIPDPVFRQQMQAVFDAQPQLAEQFPGGVVQFFELMNNLPPDAIQDMLLGAGMLGDGMEMEDGGMPGELPGFEGLMHEEIAQNPPHGDQGDLEAPIDDEGSEEEEEDSSTIPRVLRNLLGRFWGRAPADSSSDEDEAAPADDTGVD